MSEENINSGGKYTDKTSTLIPSSSNYESEETNDNSSEQLSTKEQGKLNASDYLKTRFIQQNEKVQRAQETAEQIKKTINTTKTVGNILLKIIQFLISPPGLIALAALTIIWIIFSFSLISGPTKFGSVCQPNGAPEVELLPEEERKSAVANYLVGSGGISKYSSAYLTELAMAKETTDFSKSLGLPKDCDTKCLYNKMLNNEIDMTKVKVGGFNLTGEDAAQLISEAYRNDKEWTSSSVQLAYLQKMVSGSATAEDSPLTSDDKEKTEESIKKINNILGISMSDSQVKDFAKKSIKTGDEASSDSASCVPMGTGQCVGRMDGGGATCDGGNGGSANIGGGAIKDLEEVLGKQVDMDGAYGGQCWDLTNMYLQKNGSRGISGGSGRAAYIGHDFKSQLESEGFTVILNPSISEIKPGDVVNICPGRGVSDAYYGHTGVISEVKGGGNFTVYEQNAEKGQIVALYERTYSDGHVCSIVRK